MAYEPLTTHSHIRGQRSYGGHIKPLPIGMSVEEYGMESPIKITMDILPHPPAKLSDFYSLS